MTSLSTFNNEGLDLGNNNVNMTYLYGVSDFFASMFEDVSAVNLFLESTSQSASEIYSQFLQLTSTISLNDIQQFSGKSMHLLILKNTDAVSGELNTYVIDSTLMGSRYVANRPFLPTALLENDIDYRFETLTDGRYVIRFSKDITNLGFPVRLLSDEITKEYALWFVDAKFDERWISNYFGNLIGISPQASSEVFKNFIYGLYYMYTHGPTLELFRKGLNLALGIPLCRGEETVLEIRRYLETDQYLVVTDANQYIIPYGLAPIVAEGDALVTSQELAQWVEIKDYVNDGDWWINLMIPETIIPTLPLGQKDRYATAGSHYDYLMRNYLKTHTFLVNVKVTNFKNNQVFSQLSDIIKNVKPSYTEAIYVWSLETQVENIDLIEEIILSINVHKCEYLNTPITKFYRGNSIDPLTRDCPVFMRNSVSYGVNAQLGKDAYTNGAQGFYSGGTRTGFVNASNSFRPSTLVERAWVRAVQTRNQNSYRGRRSQVSFSRNINATSDTTFNNTGVPTQWLYDFYDIPKTMRIIHLYVTTQYDVAYKFAQIGLPAPSLSEWVFSALGPSTNSEAINAVAINDSPRKDQLQILTDNFDTLFFRGSNAFYLGATIPPSGYSSWAPASVGEIVDGDFLIGVRVYENTVGMFWVTSNQTSQPSFRVEEETDALKVAFTSRMLRGMGPTGSSAYLTRGFAQLDYNRNIVSNTFSDNINPSPIIRTRGGTIINHKMELK